VKFPPLAPVIGKIDPSSGAESEHVPQMAKMPWYPRDFASATRAWPLAARAIYRELLDAQWDMGSLPDDATDLRALALATPAEWRIGWRYVEPKFPIGADGRLRNPRLEMHRRKAIEQFKSQSAGGRAGNLTRWGRQ
jgi:uncharacterized protein YdaU (DUF1376 family)